MNQTAIYGDTVGGGGTCGPDGVVDLSDIIATLDAFRSVYQGGCNQANLDLARSEDDCGRDGIIELRDILAVLDAFEGAANCCP